MRVYNFSPGPAMMPESVLRRASEEMLDYKGSGMSVMEMSHRSKVFIEIADQAEAMLRRVMSIPDNYKVLFLQGGATLQFAMVPMNLLGRFRRADYVITGNFANKAYKEAKKYGDIRVAGTSEDKGFSYIPQQAELDLDSGAAYLHYCMNNTVYGSKWNYIPQTRDNIPLVCDMSSCILSEPVDVSKFGLIYAGAQKNMGPSGLTVVIIRDDLPGACLHYTPSWMDYAVQVKHASMYNTPSCYGIYLLGLILNWLDDLGGLKEMEKINREKAGIVYDVLDNSSLYKTFIEKPYRSLMNITFKTGDEALDAKFVKEASARGLINVKGYRDLGGMRASLYNAMPMDGARALAQFMRDFEKENA
jgi:phosphoserine aminotransferase